MEYDPYRRWLDVEREAALSSHYALLGLPQFEADTARIRVAYSAAMARLHVWEISSKHSEVAHQLLHQVSAAYVCLADPDRKQQYDQQLGSRATLGDATAATDTRTDSELAPGRLEPPIPRAKSLPAPVPRRPLVATLPTAAAPSWATGWQAVIPAALAALMLVAAVWIFPTWGPQSAGVISPPSADDAEMQPIPPEPVDTGSHAVTREQSVWADSAVDPVADPDPQPEDPRPRLQVSWALELLSDAFPPDLPVSMITARGVFPGGSSGTGGVDGQPFLLAGLTPDEHVVYLHAQERFELQANPSRPDSELFVMDAQYRCCCRIYLDGADLWAIPVAAEGRTAASIRSTLANCVLELRGTENRGIGLIALFRPAEVRIGLTGSGTFARLPADCLPGGDDELFLAEGHLRIGADRLDYGQHWRTKDPVCAWSVPGLAELQSGEVQLRRSADGLEVGVACRADLTELQRLEALGVQRRGEIDKLQRLEQGVRQLESNGEEGRDVAQLADLLGLDVPEAPQRPGAEPKEDDFPDRGGSSGERERFRQYQMALKEYKKKRYSWINRVPRYKIELRELRQSSEERRGQLERSLQEAEAAHAQLATSLPGEPAWQELNACLYRLVRLRGATFRVPVMELIVTRETAEVGGTES